MRRFLALSVVFAGAVVIVALALAFAAVQNAAAPVEDPASVERGRQVYDRQRCAACHSIAGEGNTRYPLDGVGRRLSAEVIRKWIVEPRALDPKVRKPEFDITEPDLAALVEYLTALGNARED